MYDISDSISYTQACRERSMLLNFHSQLMDFMCGLSGLDIDDVDPDTVGEVLRQTAEALNVREQACGRYERGEPTDDDDNAAYVGRMSAERRAAR